MPGACLTAKAADLMETARKKRKETLKKAGDVNGPCYEIGASVLLISRFDRQLFLQALSPQALSPPFSSSRESLLSLMSDWCPRDKEDTAVMCW